MNDRLDISEIFLKGPLNHTHTHAKKKKNTKKQQQQKKQQKNKKT